MSDTKSQKWYMERFMFLREEIVLDKALIWVFSHPDYQWVNRKSYEVFKQTDGNNFVYHDSYETEQEAREVCQQWLSL